MRTNKRVSNKTAVGGQAKIQNNKNNKGGQKKTFQKNNQK
jgi:hypothetical protein